MNTPLETNTQITEGNLKLAETDNSSNKGCQSEFQYF